MASIACDRDEDCVDERFCNGEESCVDGLCQPGSDPCADFEEEGCVVKCSEGDSSAECALNVEDEDEDGHAATGNTCSADPEVPRDDCDDTEGAAYPENEEVCDGIDNDCDGLSDLQEGMPLGGSWVPVYASSMDEGGGFQPAVAWSETQNLWVVLWGTDKRLLARAVGSDGTPVGEAQELLADGLPHQGEKAVTWTGDTLAVFWDNDGDYFFARFRWDGSETAPVQIDAVPIPIVGSFSTSRLVHVDDGGWLLSTTLSGDATVYRFNSKGAFLPPAVDLGATEWVNGAATSNGVGAAVWKTTSYDSEDTWLGGGFSWASWSGPNMSPAQMETVLWEADKTITGGTAQAMPTEDGFVFLLRPKGQDVNIQRVALDGSVLCGPATITGTGLPAGIDGELYATGNPTSGFYVARSPENGVSGWFVLPVPYDCDVNSVLQGESFAELGSFQIATVALGSNSAGHMVAALSSNVTPPEVQVRTFGNAFCDVPD